MVVIVATYHRVITDFANTNTAQKVRAARKISHRTVQKSCVLYAYQARHMVKRKQEAQLEKAEVALRRAQYAMEKAASAERKPVLKEAKAYRTKMFKLQASQKKIMKTLCIEIRKEGCKRHLYMK